MLPNDNSMLMTLTPLPGDKDEDEHQHENEGEEVRPKNRSWRILWVRLVTSCLVLSELLK